MHGDAKLGERAAREAHLFLGLGGAAKSRRGGAHMFCHSIDSIVCANVSCKEGVVVAPQAWLSCAAGATWALKPMEQ